MKMTLIHFIKHWYQLSSLIKIFCQNCTKKWYQFSSTYSFWQFFAYQFSSARTKEYNCLEMYLTPKVGLLILLGLYRRGSYGKFEGCSNYYICNNFWIIMIDFDNRLSKFFVARLKNTNFLVLHYIIYIVYKYNE